MLPLVRKVAETLENNRYEIFKRPFELNLIAIRKDNARERTQHNIKSPVRSSENLFFDQLIVFYYDENEKIEFSLYEIATVPQLREFQETQILVPNQYKQCFMLKDSRLHQTEELDTFTDNFKENREFFDPFSMKTGDFEIGIGDKSDRNSFHRFKEKLAYKEFLELCNIHIQYYGNSFTYTLLEEHDIVVHNKTNYVL